MIIICLYLMQYKLKVILLFYLVALFYSLCLLFYFFDLNLYFKLKADDP
jgi:hypothetical protein